MPKKKGKPLEQAEQSERFRKAVRDLEAAGELSPTADADFEKVVTTIAKPRRPA